MVDSPPEQGDDDDAKAHERRGLLQRLAVVGPLALGLLVILLLACVFWIPRSLYPPLTQTDLHGVSDAAKVQELKGARLQLENDARTTLLQGLAAVLILIGAGIGAAVTLRQIRISQGQLQATREQMQHTLETAQQQLNLTEQGQVTDRYTKAIDQLGSDHLDVRLGGIYALERIARDSPPDRATIEEILTAFVRGHAPWPPPPGDPPLAGHEQQGQPGKEDAEPQEPPADVQAAMTVLGRRELPPDGLRPLDLRRVDLRYAFLAEADLQVTSVALANLQGAILYRAKLQSAVLFDAQLQGANLDIADLQGAELTAANLEKAFLKEANLQGAWLRDANLHGAELGSANLQGASLDGTNLNGALADVRTRWPAGWTRETAKARGVEYRD